jgi:hypothetical protein
MATVWKPCTDHARTDITIRDGHDTWRWAGDRGRSRRATMRIITGGCQVSGPKLVLTDNANPVTPIEKPGSQRPYRRLRLPHI